MLIMWRDVEENIKSNASFTMAMYKLSSSIPFVCYAGYMLYILIQRERSVYMRERENRKRLRERREAKKEKKQSER